jgi:hypothetical protein
MYTDGTVLSETERKSSKAGTAPEIKKEVTLGTTGFWYVTFLVFIQVVLVTMVYGPIAAFLVELFPTRIRYTSMSLPYHIGNGVFGGLVPFISNAVVVTTNNPFSGLWYPIGVAGLTFVIGMIFLKNKKPVDND